MVTTLLIIGALLAELAAVLSLLHAPEMRELLHALTLHALAAALFSYGCYRILPPRYRRQPLSVMGYTAAVPFFVPGIGMPCLLLVVVLSLIRENVVGFNPAEETGIPQLPYRPFTTDAGISLVEGGSYDIMQHSSSIERRMKVVRAGSRMDDQQGVPLLKEALKDHADEVRLLAYSILDKKESEFNASINALLSRLERCEAEDRPALQKQLAFRYWDIVYLGLAEGDVRRHLLELAKRYCEAALADEVEPGAYHLLGRIHLQFRQPDEAQRCFELAVENGYNAENCLTYLAEVAYLQGDYRRIPELLSRLPEETRTLPPICHIAEYWLEENGR